MASNEAAILIKLLADKSNLDVTLKDAEGSIINFDKKVKGLAGEMAGALGGMFAGAAIGKVLMDGVMGANELATGLGRLQVVINNFNPGMKTTTEEIKAWTEATAVGTKFTHDELIPALEKAVVKVKDYATAQQIVKDAIKLSTLANIPLEEATNQLSLAHEGFSRGLMMTAGQIGLNVKEGANYNDIINKINEGYAGMAVVVEGDLTVAIKKAKDEVGDLLEETLVPALPVIINFVKGIEVAFKVLWTSLLITGKYIGTITGALFLIAQGKFKEAKDQTIQSIKDAKAEIEGLLKGKKGTDGTGRIGLPAKTPKDGDAKLKGIEKEEKAIEELEKAHAKLLETQRKAWEEDKKRQLEKKKKLKEEADWVGVTPAQKAYIQEVNRLNEMLDAGVLSQEKYNAALGKAKQAYGEAALQSNVLASAIGSSLMSATNSLADTMVDAMNGMKVSWSDWAQSVIQDIERVIIKYILLQALTGGTGLASGGILGAITSLFTGGSKAAGFGGSSGDGGTPQIQIITADPATTVRFINNAYGNATPKAQAQLYRNVQKGQLNDYNR